MYPHKNNLKILDDFQITIIKTSVLDVILKTLKYLVSLWNPIATHCLLMKLLVRNPQVVLKAIAFLTQSIRVIYNGNYALQMSLSLSLWVLTCPLCTWWQNKPKVIAGAWVGWRNAVVVVFRPFLFLCVRGGGCIVGECSLLLLPPPWRNRYELVTAVFVSPREHFCSFFLN